MNVYLAGKISKNDWRHDLTAVKRLRTESWEQASALPMTTGDTYVGPFFISCDHGCSHGENAHGAGFTCGDERRGYDEYVTGHRVKVREKAIAGIKSCDIFIAYLGVDFKSAYGTMTEIGVAHALGKPIILVIHPQIDTKDFWFLKSMANRALVSDDPSDAVYSLLTFDYRAAAFRSEYVDSVPTIILERAVE